MKTRTISRRKRQSGIVLVAALIILLLVTLIGTSGVRTGVLELQISANEEERLLALQIAQAATDEITESSGNFVVAGLPGEVTKCTSGLACLDSTLTFDSQVLAHVDNASIERLHPSQGNPPRLVSASSSRAFSATFFQVNIDYDREDHGRAQISHGYMKLINSSNN